jgi:hypothetical protein
MRSVRDWSIALSSDISATANKIHPCPHPFCSFNMIVILEVQTMSLIFLYFVSTTMVQRAKFKQVMVPRKAR